MENGPARIQFNLYILDQTQWNTLLSFPVIPVLICFNSLGLRDFWTTFQYGSSSVIWASFGKSPLDLNDLIFKWPRRVMYGPHSNFPYIGNLDNMYM